MKEMNKETFDFSEALRRMKQGKKVRKGSRLRDEILYYDPKRNAIMVMFDGTNSVKKTAMACINILATDWEEVEG